VFTVRGRHRYAEEGSYPITITVHHGTAPNLTVRDRADVSDPRPTLVTWLPLLASDWEVWWSAARAELGSGKGV
jgi:hypothetical protein